MKMFYTFEFINIFLSLFHIFTLSNRLKNYVILYPPYIKFQTNQKKGHTTAISNVSLRI